LGNYEVGYGKPPVQSQFKKGESGNPRGRRRRTESERAKAIALKAAYGLVTVRDGETTTQMTRLEAVLRSQMALATKGNGPAGRAVWKIVREIEVELKALDMDMLQSAIAYKVETQHRLARKRRLGISDGEANPAMPHPDDIDIDYETGEVAFDHEDFAGLQRRKKDGSW
jgi:hypothetical protein